MSKPFNIHDWQAKQKQLSEIRAQDVPGTAAFMGKNMRSGGMSNSEKNKASVDAFFKDLRDKEENPVVAKGDGIEITQDEMDKLHRDGRVRLKDGSLLVFPSKPLKVKEDDIDEASMTGTGASFNAGSGEGYMTPNAFKKKKKK